MFERTLLAPLPFLDETASEFPYELGHGFSLQRFTKPVWLEHERKWCSFLNQTEIEKLDKEKYWLALTVTGEAAVGKAEDEAASKMNLFVFLATLFSPCYDMFMPSFLVEKTSTSPEGCVQRASGLGEESQLTLPEVFRHNVLTLESLRWSSRWFDRSLVLHSSPILTFRIVGTLWRVGFKQRIRELQLLLWTMGIESVLGSTGKREFVERLQTLLDGGEALYQGGTYDRLGVRRGSDYTIGHLWNALYDARGQVAHGQAFSTQFLNKVQSRLAGLNPPKWLGEDVPLEDVLIEASCLLLQRLLIAAIQDERYAFLLEDGTARDRRLRALVANQTPVWSSP